MVPYLQKYCFDAQFFMDASQYAILNRKVVLGNISIYSDVKSTKDISLCVSAGNASLEEIDLAINFNENLDRTRV
jgi:hypothetical protein